MDMILKEFKKDLIAVLTSEKTFNKSNSEWEGGTSADINFKGAILSLSEKDLKVLPEGTYNLDDQKLYTDQVFLNDTIIKDGSKEYKIYAVREYNIVDSNFKRYYMKRVSKTNG